MSDPTELRPDALPPRVLEPPGAAPAGATHLDPDPRVRGGEVLVALEHLLLDPEGETGVARASGGAPERQRAALLEAATERGAVPLDLDGAALVGRVSASSAPDLVGRRVGIPPPLAGVPLWLRDVSAWQGGRHVPCTGHAVVPGPEALVLLPEDLAAEAAAAVTAVAHTPALVRRASRDWDADAGVLVLGAGTLAGATAVGTATAAGCAVVGVVTSLAEARIARALGAVGATIAPLDPPADGARAVLTDVAGLDVPAPAAIVLADPRGVAIAAAALLAGTTGADVVALDPAQAASLVREASGVGCSPLVVTGRTLQVTPGEWPADLSDLDPTLRAVAAWRAGVGEVPAPTGPEDA